MMSDRTCSRCTNKLATTNTNPDDLCAKCQNFLGSHNPTSAKYNAWIKEGKPRVAEPPARPHSQRRPRKDHNGKHLPDVRSLPTAFLINCVHELTRREVEARETIAILEKLKKS